MKKPSFKLNAQNKVLRQRLNGGGILLSIFTECQKAKTLACARVPHCLYLANKDFQAPAKFKGQASEARQELL